MQYPIELVPVSKFNDYIDYPTVGAIRQLIFYNKDKFKDIVVRYIGKRQYISVPDFYKWIDISNQSTGIEGRGK